RLLQSSRQGQAPGQLRRFSRKMLADDRSHRVPGEVNPAGARRLNHLPKIVDMTPDRDRFRNGGTSLAGQIVSDHVEIALENLRLRVPRVAGPSQAVYQDEGFSLASKVFDKQSASHGQRSTPRSA